MKKMKKFAAFFLAVAMVLSLSACGSFATKMAKAVKKMEAVKSYHMSMTVPMSMTLSVLGQEVNSDMNMGWELDVCKEPMTAAGTISAAMLGMESEEIPFYMEKVGDEYKVYTQSVLGWNVETLSADQEPVQIDTVSGLKIFMEAGKIFEEAGSETVSGSKATRFDGVIEGEYVAAVLSMSGVKDMLSEILGAELDEQALAGLGGVPTSIWIDDASGMIVRYDMEMSELINALTSQLVDSVKDEYGLEGLDMDISIRSLNASVVLSDFDRIGQIEIPAEARAAA